MDKITAIEPQKRRPKRRSIFVNGEFAAGVDQEVVLTLGLKVGQQVDEARLKEMLQAEEVRKAREAALNLLGYRSRSENELELRLKQKGYEEDIIQVVLTGLKRVDLVNDERFADDWVKNRMASRPMGRTRLSWELRRKGISAKMIDETLEELDEEKEYQAALTLAESKLNKSLDIDVRAEKRRVGGLLQRRGFNWGIVSRVLDTIFQNEEDFEC